MRRWTLVFLLIWLQFQTGRFFVPNPATLISGAARTSLVSGFNLASIAGCYEALQNALAALQDGDAASAQTAVMRARRLVAECEPSEQEELKPLIRAVADRIGQAAAFGGRPATAAGNRDTTQETRKMIAERDGDKLVYTATRRFDEKNYTAAVALINEARDCYQSAGDGGELAREREKGVVGNLYAVVLVEIEREQRMKKLIALKRLGDMVKLKKQAEAYGIDWDEFQGISEVEGLADKQP